MRFPERLNGSDDHIGINLVHFCLDDADLKRRQIGFHIAGGF